MKSARHAATTHATIVFSVSDLSGRALDADASAHALGGGEATTGLQPLQRFGDGAVSGAAVIIGAKILAMLVSLVTVAIVARILTPADYGLVAMVLSVTAFLAVFSDLGLSYVTIQRPNITQEQLSALFWANIAFGGLLGAVTAALAPALVWFYHDARLLPVTVLLAAVFPIAAAGVQHQALLKRRMLFRRYALTQLTGTGAGAIVSIAMALAGAGYWALACQSLVTVLASSLSAWLHLRWLPGPPRRCPELRAMLGFGGRLTAHGMVGYLETNLDKLLLGRFCGPYALGLYATSYHLVGRVVGLAAYNVGEAAIPAMARASTTVAGPRPTYRRMLQLTCLLGLPAALAGVLWTDDVVLTVFGNRWQPAAPILRLLFIGALPRMLAASTGWVFVAGGRPGRMLRWELIQAPLIAVAFIVALPYGAYGVAWAYALANWIAFVPAFAYCFRGSPFHARDVLVPAGASLICALFAGLATALVRLLLPLQVAPGALSLMVSAAFFTVFYGASSLICVPLAREVLHKALSCARAWAGCSARLPAMIAPLKTIAED